MKKTRRILNRWPALLVVVFLIPGGCSKEPETETPSGEFQPRDVEVSASVAMKSVVPDWFWEESDLFSLYTTGVSTNSNLPFGFASVDESGMSGRISGTVHQSATGSHIFTAAYPYDENAASDPANYAIEVPSSQNITTESIDPSTFIVTAGPIEKDIPATGSVSLDEMNFSTPLAFVKMAFTNQYPYFSADEMVTGVRFSVINSNYDLAGKALYDLTAGSFVEVVSGNLSRVDALYAENAGPLAASDFTCWFTAFPFAVQAGGKYSVTITTDLQTLTGTFTAEEWLSFDAGITTLAVTIDSSFETDVPLEEQWGQITSASDVTDGNYVIAGYVNSNWIALSTSSLTAANSNPEGVLITLTSSGGALADDPSNDIVWTFTGNNTSGFVVSSDAPSYLYADPSATPTQALTYTTSDPGLNWVFANNSSGYLGMRPYGGSIYVTPYYSNAAGYDWRSYTSFNSTFSLFKEGVLAPAPRPTVTSGAVSGVTLESVTFNGSFNNPTAYTAESAGFSYGTTTSMGSTVDAAFNGTSFSASLSGLPQGTRYYYKAYVVINGVKYEGATKNFRTALPGPASKSWLELPNKMTGTDMIAKTYYETLGDGKWGRNYSILFDPANKVALWVAYPMHAATHLGDSGRTDKWSYDNDGDIPIAYQPAIVNSSYAGDYDRGHQMASGDRTCNYAVNAQTFYMTNMTPQHFNLNQGVWRSLEIAVQSLTKSGIPERDTLYVVTGPLIAENPKNFTTDSNGNQCPLPEKYFKVILWSKYEGGGRSYDSVGFLFENRSYGTGAQYSDYAKTVRDIETATGLTFFDNLGLSSSQMTTIKSTSTWSSFSTR